MRAARPMLAPAIVLAVVVTLLGRPAVGQVPTPTPTEQECVPGQLCVPRPQEVRTGPGAPVNDPPGAYVRSLTTMGGMALVVGIYLYIAMTGKSLRRRRRQAGGPSH